MILIGAGVLPAVIKSHTNWSWGISIAAGFIPGAVLGFLASLLLSWVVYWTCLIVLRCAKGVRRALER
jgi:hypothetical protein